ncbi:MAG: tRNA uridine-5-carboxymethylaminomethyl(34) synthesis GTPase MnmE [Aestuariibacter sp.]
MNNSNADTIVAQATSPGRGSVGIVRISGSLALEVAKRILKFEPTPRQAHYCPFYNVNDEPIDQGIALYFAAPHSFTGEHVLELQGHGGQIVINMLLETIAAIPGVRFANPGEFSQRAFLNDKMDLAQAEAIADLIDASSTQAAKSAMVSLRGDFSDHIHRLVEQLIALRMYVEAAIDFPEEEIDFLSDGKIQNDLHQILQQLADTLDKTRQGSLLREGMKVVIAGKPNAGKSSLLNALSGKETAIVTEIAGTTRDVIKEHINIDGMPLHIVDTAGLRESEDAVERIGIEKAWQEIQQADRILLLADASATKAEDPELIWPEFFHKLPPGIGLTIIRNKCDISQESPGLHQTQQLPVVAISAKQGLGLDALKQHLKDCMGFHNLAEGQFIARARHVNALQEALLHVENGKTQLLEFAAGELLAEELRLAQSQLSEITGEFTSDDLLGRIFSSFCIGK